VKKILSLILLFTLIAVLGGCKKKEKNEIVIAEVTHSVFYAPQYVAMSQGFFEEEGLKVSYITTPGADKVMAALLSKDCQIGLAGAEASIYVYNEGQADYAINFAQLTQKDGNFLVGRTKIDNFKFSMLSGAEILGGRRGGMPEMVLEYALKQNGLQVGRDDPSKEVNVRTDVQFAALAGVFNSGEADYVTLFEPTATLLENDGKGYVLASLGTETGVIPYTNYFATKSYIENNSEIIQKFTNAIYKASQWVYSHTSAQVAEACITYFPDSTLNQLTKVMQRYMDIEAWAKSPVLEKGPFDHFLEIMEAAGELSTRPPYDKIVTTTFGKKALEG
jgi:NitT/TauT family transport system substrate-binding protein